MKSPSMVRTCSDCTHPTRPCSATVADYPGTSRRYGELCQNCYRAEGRASTQARGQAHPYTLAGLASFVRRRNDRKAVMVRREMCAQ